jgi:hexosaminidase
MLRNILTDPVRHRHEIQSIRFLFSQWSANESSLKPLVQNTFLLEELEPLSENLSKVGDIGLRALQFLESGEQAPANWVTEQKQTLSRIEKPQAEVVLAAVRPVRVLLDTVSQAAVPSSQARKTGVGGRDK